jgi:hypothetical protein
MWVASLLPVFALVAADQAAPLAVPAPPPPIFWRQTLFSIPFQVQQPANPAQEPAEVLLYVSPDRGVHWDNRPWMKAQPKKGYFLFRAGSDGEYWFDVRTVDRAGQVHPQGLNAAKLVVVVDTVPPKIQLTARRGDDGRITANFRIEEPYLRADSLMIDYRAAPGAAWQGVLVAPNEIHSNNAVHTAEATWFPSPQNAAGTIEVRLRVSDMAGNPAEVHAQVNMSATAASDARFSAAPPGDATLRIVGAASQPPAMSVAQMRIPWPAENTVAAAAGPAPPADRYGNVVGPDGGSVAIRVNPPAANQLVAVRDQAAPPAAASAAPMPAFSEFRPGTSNPPDMRAAQNPPNTFNGLTPGASASAASPAVEKDVAPPPGTALRWINSRVFQLTYDTRALGSSDNVGVELWGSRDGGKTWQSFGADARGQSPMLVTVPEESIYGFQMKLLNGGPAGRPPLSGEAPRTWIGVDLTRPTGRITQARQGAGRDADKLFITWEAGDNRALADKPIALSYSERPSGPWTPIAGDLPNTGQYVWQLKANLPQRAYLRLEVRDAAGNVATIETPEPAALDLSAPTVPLGELRPLGWAEPRTGEPTYLR